MLRLRIALQLNVNLPRHLSLEACGMLRLRIALQLNVNLPRHLSAVSVPAVTKVHKMDLVPPEPRGMLRLRISLQLNVNLLRHQHRLSLNAGEARGVFYPSNRNAPARPVPQCTRGVEQPKVSGRTNRSGPGAWKWNRKPKGKCKTEVRTEAMSLCTHAKALPSLRFQTYGSGIRRCRVIRRMCLRCPSLTVQNQRRWMATYHRRWRKTSTGSCRARLCTGQSRRHVHSDNAQNG